MSWMLSPATMTSRCASEAVICHEHSAAKVLLISLSQCQAYMQTLDACVYQS